ncbi:MAG: hypothetical protein ACW96X_05250 [Promethearchaeota archaeon]|jgi:hypothetical protein
MNLQYYETLGDKSKDYLLYLIEQILPKFTISELKIILADIGTNPKEGTKKSKSKAKKGFVQIGADIDKKADLSKLNLEQLKTLFQIFISRELSNQSAVKWRFYQNIKYMSELNVESVKVNQDLNPDGQIDFIIDTNENEVLLASCHDILELNNFNKVIAEIINYAKKENLLPDQIIFAANKSFRNIPLETPIKIISTEVIPSLMIEWTEENRQFKRKDLLIVNDSELKIAGFNFISTDDLLKYVYKHTNGGQISIFRQFDFYTEVSEDDPEVELIWKGIMIKE